MPYWGSAGRAPRSWASQPLARTQRHRIVMAIATTVVLTSMSTACSSGDPKTESPPPVQVTASPPAEKFDEAGLPLDVYTLTSDQYSDLDYATKLLARKCMKRFGIDWNLGGRGASPFRGRNYGPGLVDKDRAATYGYHPTPEEAASKDKGTGLTAEQTKILSGVGPGEKANPGVPEGGCYGEARRTLGWNMDPFMWLQQLGIDAMTRTLEHPRVQAAKTRWSECMKAAGYTYAGPDQAVNDPAWWKDEKATASAREINTAVADVRCKTETNYVGELTVVLAANQKEQVEKNFERLETVRKETEAALRKAAGILANPGG